MLGTSLLLASVIMQERDAAKMRAWDETYNLSGAFEVQVRRIMDGVRGAMTLLKPRLAAEGAGFDLPDWFAHAPEFADTTVLVSFVAPDGKLVSTSHDRHPEPIDLSDREYIRAHIEGSNGLIVSKPVLGRISKRMIIPVTDRIETADGKFAGILFFSLSPHLLAALHKSVRLDDGGSVILAGTDGVIRSAYAGLQKPDIDYIGASISGAPVVDAAAAAADAGAYEGKSPLSSEPAFLNWRKVAGYPLLVLAGVGEAQIFAVANWNAIMLGAMGASVFALTLTITAILYREIGRRVEREIALFDKSRKVVKANKNLQRRHVELLKTSAALTAERGRLQCLNRELGRAKFAAEQANQAKTSFLMNMTHEFRTPMHAILNYTSMGLKRLENQDFDKLKKYLHHINTSGVRLLRMFNALLDLAKLESGKCDLRFSHGDLAHIVALSHAEIDSLFEAKQLRLDFEKRTANTAAAFDRQQIMQVFTHLFSNAIKFSPPQSSVKVVIETGKLPGQRPALHCSVSDEGPGIPESELEAVFDKFVQSTRTASGAGGSGLGLAICREIVHLHQGKIWASNRTTGGAAVHFVLPTDLASLTPDAPQQPKRQQKPALPANRLAQG
jgi:signal transduction histidine kinase